LTAAVVRNITHSILLALFAAALEVAVFPRTYSYPKVTMYALVFWLYGRYLSAPTTRRLVGVAAGIAAAFMFRHDHGLFLWAGGVATVGLAVSQHSWKRAVRDAAALTAAVGVLLLPYLVFVQIFTGLGTYFMTGVEFSQREAVRQWHVWPKVFGDARPLESAMVYELHALPLMACAVLLLYRRRDDVRAVVARVLPVALVAVLVNISFIRDPLNTRLADAIVPAVVLLTWLLAMAFWRSGARLVAVPLTLAFTALMSASVLTVGYTAEEIDRAGLLGRRQEIPGRFVERTADLRNRFTEYQIPTEASRRLVHFFRYVDRCSLPSDRILVGGFLVEAPFYANRPFAAGQEYFGSYFHSDANERWAFERLQRQRVPFVVVPSDERGEFDGFFLVAPYIQEHYAPLADVMVDDEKTIEILVSRELTPTATDAETGWPCFASPATR
jgi:hypothetical protein